MALDFEKVEQLIADGFISKRKHPDLDLWILNYSAKTQWERHWTPETMACRGLIVDGNNNIVARSFPKFFNYEELEQIPSELVRFQEAILNDELFQVSEKLDGSLIICFQYQGEMVVASRGSFESDQSRWAEGILGEKHPRFFPEEGLTYLFELIHPENRIVVNYGEIEDLYLLVVIDTQTGVELVEPGYGRFLEPYTSEEFASFEDVVNFPQRANAEGFVVTFLDSQLRVKLKWAEYKRLHKLLTGVIPKTIWEILSAGGNLDEMLELVPDEWMEWVREVENQLKDKYFSIKGGCEILFQFYKGQNLPDRKAYAEAFKTTAYPAVLFQMLDGRDPSVLIWKMCKPESGRAFRCSEG